jgi:ATP-dependent RNA helicase RhlE
MSFTSFQLHPRVAAGVAAAGYTTPTPIQTQAIPPILAGKDMLGLAQTGTGKTAAFVLPMLQRLLDGPRNTVRALIVAPTRELAGQINDNIRSMAVQTGLRSVVIYGGVGKQAQAKALRSGVEIVVACPGRLLDHLQDKALDLGRVEILVLDEADHMFDKGFLPDIRRIIRALPRQRQTLVFSATMPTEIRHLTEEILHEPACVQINHTLPAATISHVLFSVEKEKKTSLLKGLLEQRQIATALVFTRTKHKAKSLALHLEKAGYRATSLQGNLSQQKRQVAMDGFRDGTFTILVATDIAARGIDVPGISHVINYDVPDTAETYTHRIGRTGRAERTGEALTFAASEDRPMVQAIERCLGKKMAREEITGFKCEIDTSCDERPARPPRQMPRRSGGATAAPAAGNRNRNRSGRSRASAFDFGVQKRDQR